MQHQKPNPDGLASPPGLAPIFCKGLNNANTNTALVVGDKMTPHAYTQALDEMGHTGAAMHAANTKRLTTRITNHVQEKLQMGADLVGATLNQFVVQAALEKADRIIETESTIVLTRRESLRMLELLDNPPPRNAKFLQAQARYQRVKNRDVPPAGRQA